ncbi:MAG: UDP-N-acetylmuramate dehydrogenase [Pseudomonadota bacterium]
MTVATLPQVRGKLTENAPLAPLVWFKSGGTAQWLFEPKDLDDLQQFLRDLDTGVTVWPLGLGSNLIIRDGGIQGVVIRLGKAFAGIETVSKGTFGIDDVLICGAGAPGISAASMARDHGIAGLEFLRGIPGTIGGAVRMNAGAYGREVADILESADVMLRSGELQTIALADMGYSYRHSRLPEGAIVVGARFRGESGDPEIIGAEMKRIADEREASQPLRTKTGGSTFKNPDGKKAWQLVDEAGCRGLQMGQAQVSEKHCNFLINLGGATSADIEALGEEVRKRVQAHSGVELHWEIQRVGDTA